jgi:hypothetical protein
MLKVSSGSPLMSTRPGDELCAIDFAGEEERQTALARTLLRVVRVRRVVVASDQRVDDQVLVFTEDARQAGPVPGESARRAPPAAGGADDSGQAGVCRDGRPLAFVGMESVAFQQLLALEAAKHRDIPRYARCGGKARASWPASCPLSSRRSGRRPTCRTRRPGWTTS